MGYHKAVLRTLSSLHTQRRSIQHSKTPVSSEQCCYVSPLSDFWVLRIGLGCVFAWWIPLGILVHSHRWQYWHLLAPFPTLPSITSTGPHKRGRDSSFPAPKALVCILQEEGALVDLFGRFLFYFLVRKMDQLGFENFGLSNQTCIVVGALELLNLHWARNNCKVVQIFRWHFPSPFLCSLFHDFVVPFSNRLSSAGSIWL